MDMAPRDMFIDSQVPRDLLKMSEVEERRQKETKKAVKYVRIGD